MFVKRGLYVSHRHDHLSLPSSPYRPSLDSKITLGSRTSTVCHAPLRIWHPCLPSSGQSCMRPVSRPLSSYRISSSRPWRQMTVSEEKGWRCMSTLVPGMSTFSIRWERSSSEFLRSILNLWRGQSAAFLKRSSKFFSVNSI